MPPAWLLCLGWIVLSSLRGASGGCPGKRRRPYWKCDPDACSDHHDPQVIHLQSMYALGNHMVMMQNILGMAANHNCTVRVDVHPSYPFLNYCSCFRPLRRRWGIVRQPCSTQQLNSSEKYFWVTVPNPPPLHETGDALRLYLGANDTHFLERRCSDMKDQLTVKLRSHDLFWGDWAGDHWVPHSQINSIYGQPPMAYFLFLLAYRKWKRVLFLCQDLMNPTCAVLAQLKLLNLPEVEVRSEVELQEALWLMGCSENVGNSVSTMSHIWEHSPHIKTEFFFWTQKEPHPCTPCVPRHVVYWNAENYFQYSEPLHSRSVTFAWRNTEEDRMTLLKPLAFNLTHCTENSEDPFPLPLAYSGPVAIDI